MTPTPLFPDLDAWHDWYRAEAFRRLGRACQEMIALGHVRGRDVPDFEDPMLTQVLNDVLVYELVRVHQAQDDLAGRPGGRVAGSREAREILRRAELGELG